MEIHVAPRRAESAITAVGEVQARPPNAKGTSASTGDPPAIFTMAAWQQDSPTWLARRFRSGGYHHVGLGRIGRVGDRDRR